MSNYRFKFKNGRMKVVKPLRDKVILATKVIGSITLVGYLAFTGIASYKYLTETIELKNNLAIKTEEISKLNSTIEEDKQVIKDLNTIIKNNEDRYQLIETIEKEAKKIATENTKLKEENRGLYTYIQMKTGTKLTKVESVKLEVTKYTNEEGWWAPGDPRWGTMASGQKTYDGAVAMPRSIPFGTEVILDPGTDIATRGDNRNRNEFNKVYKVLDRGSAIVEKERNGEKVYCMDIWTNSLKDANSWGRQQKQGWLFYSEYE